MQLSVGMTPHSRKKHNEIYFALEFLEQTFFRNFIFELGKTFPVESLVYIHDGILISPKPTHSAIAEAAHSAAAIIGVPPPQLSCEDLTVAWQRNFSSLERKAATRPQKKMRTCEQNFQVGHHQPVPPLQRITVNYNISLGNKRGRAHLDKFTSSRDQQAHMEHFESPKKTIRIDNTYTNKVCPTKTCTQQANAKDLMHYFGKKRLFDA